jgi:hypothetical protein
MRSHVERGSDQCEVGQVIALGDESVMAVGNVYVKTKVPAKS